MQQVQDVMTTRPAEIHPEAPVAAAARLMKLHDAGIIVVREPDGPLEGVLTDRDVAVRIVAEGRDATVATVADVMSPDLVTITPDASLEDAIHLMRTKAVRRLPVVADDRLVGMVSIGDLAIELDGGPAGAALADISAAKGNA